MEPEIVGRTILRSPTERPGDLTPEAKSQPTLELFEPSQRQKLLDHLIQVQFPAIREVVSKSLESGYFLLDPAELSIQVVQRLVIEADEYKPETSYWDWVQSIAGLAIHEAVLSSEDEDIEALCEPTEDCEDLQNERMRRFFNRLPLEQRRALYFVGVIGHSLEDAARLADQAPEELRRHAREGLRKILEGIESECSERGENNGE